MVTIRSVNNALKARGYTDKLEKGEGYFYFYSEPGMPGASDWRTATVYVFAINQLPTVERWVEEYEYLKKVEDALN